MEQMILVIQFPYEFGQSFCNGSLAFWFIWDQTLGSLVTGLLLPLWRILITLEFINKSDSNSKSAITLISVTVPFHKKSSSTTSSFHQDYYIHHYNGDKKVSFSLLKPHLFFFLPASHMASRDVSSFTYFKDQNGHKRLEIIDI